MKYNDKATERRVLEKATELLQRHGLRGWNMDRLAEETGLAKNTLYRIIGSKEELMERVALNHCRKIYARLMKVLEEGGDYLATFEKLVYAYSELSPTFFSELFLEYPRLEETVGKHNKATKKRLLEYADRGIRDGYFYENLEAEQLLELFRSIGIFYTHAGLSSDERAEKIKFAFRCVLYGIVHK